MTQGSRTSILQCKPRQFFPVILLHMIGTGLVQMGGDCLTWQGGVFPIPTGCLPTSTHHTTPCSFTSLDGGVELN